MSLEKNSTKKTLSVILCSTLVGVSACYAGQEEDSLLALEQSLQGQSCNHGPGFDSCTEWNFTPGDLIDITNPNYPERVVAQEGDQFKVTMTPDNLFGGTIPAVANQGHYNNEQELMNRVALVLGLDPSSIPPDGANGTLTQIGISKKFDLSLGDEGFSGVSTGDVVCDAITDSEGKIWIDGVEIDTGCEEFIYDNTDQLPQPNGTSSPSAGTNVVTQGMTFHSNLGTLTEKADMKPFWREWILYRARGTKIERYYRNGERAKLKYFTCTRWHGCWAILELVTTDMSIINEYYKKENGNISFVAGSSAAHNNTYRLSSSVWAIATAGIPNVVCGTGTAGHVSGYMYSSETDCGAGDFW